MSNTGTLHGYTIFEVLKLGGLIVAHHEDSGMIVTINEVVFSYWISLGNGRFVGGNSCIPSTVEKAGDCTDIRLVVEVGQEWIGELLEEDGRDEPTNA